MIKRLKQAASLGCVLGAAAATATALSDFGAQWLWLERPAERALLLVRLLGFQIPAGALLGALLGALYAPLRRDAARAAGLAVLFSPGLVWVAWSVFEGGKMSQLPQRDALRPALALVLVLLLWTLGLGVARLFRQLDGHRGRGAWLAVGAAGCGFALSKLDQWAYPKLYDSLHASLTTACWLTFMLAATALWNALGRRDTTRAGVAAAIGAAAMLLFNLADLDRSQNVRVALMDARASHSRSLMQGLQPVLLARRDASALERSRTLAGRARARRRQSTDVQQRVSSADAHVLLITIDALRADHLGTHGYSRPTSPEIDLLAAGGLTFEHAYAPAPHSSYSLSSLMTSEYLHETLDLGQPLPEATLATALNEAGYHTAAFFTRGIFHTAAERLTRFEADAFGFAYRDHVDRPAEALTDAVLTEVDRTVARGEPASLFWVHYFDVHEPYEADHFGDSPLDRYDSEIRRVDRALGRLVRETRARLKRDVIVAITADHGEEFRDHGGLYHGSTLYDEQVRIPLILHGPGIETGRVAVPVESISLAPTLLSAVGVAAPTSMRGRDLRPPAHGQASPSTPVFSAVIYKKMVVQWPLKLIADLRFGLFELYDLEHDPLERNNLADARPEDLDRLRGEVYAWIDSLAPATANGQDGPQVALDRGRLGDRRAVPDLARLVLSDAAPVDARMEAARILGHLRDGRGVEALADGMAAEDAAVAGEAAIALGRMYDPRARAALRKLVRSPERDVRTRAAISLGRLRDSRAVPALIEALSFAAADYDREEAVRWLGRLRDPRGVDPLVAHLTDTRRRHLTVIALGLIGDLRASGPLVHLVRWAKQDGVRDNAARGLGLLGDARALETLLPLAGGSQPPMTNVTESLVRLGALEAGHIGGADIVRGSRGLSGFGNCWVGAHLHDWDYLHRTYCRTRQARVSVDLAIPEAVATAQHGSSLLVSVRRDDAATATPLRLSLGKLDLDPVEVDGSWKEFRLAVPEGPLHAGRVRAHLRLENADARILVDHILVIPNVPVELAAREN